jgi:hypothetical protein
MSAVLHELKTLLESQGLGLANVVQVNLNVADLGAFTDINKYFRGGDFFYLLKALTFVCRTGHTWRFSG